MSGSWDESGRSPGDTGLTGAVAIVTGGGGSGIGAAVCAALARRGARLVVVDVDPDLVEAKTVELRSAGATAIGVAADVSDPAAIDLVVDRAAEEFGGIDVIVNSAAIVRPAPLDEIGSEVWRAVFAVNVEGPLLLSRRALPYLRESSRAAIVNIGALGGMFGRPNGGAYGSSKAALINLSYQMALEWGGDGIRVNVVNPGTIDTPLSRQTLTPETAAHRAAAIPLRRLGAPDDVANIAAFLASPEAGYITAQFINVDGGWSQTVMSAPMQG
jgi:NAD(P)-dependent dehydrogenase (short-subunit alcohol dehydrogenase family)